MRKLPKRVIKRETGYFYPQVWFMWWHYVWKAYYGGRATESFNNADDAVRFFGTAWKDFSTPKKVTVVWRGR